MLPPCMLLQCPDVLGWRLVLRRYRELQASFSQLQSGPGGMIPVMALTATATMRVRQDIVGVLGLGKSRGGEYHACVNTFHRSNLYFAVQHTQTANCVHLLRDLAKYIAFPSSRELQAAGAPNKRGVQGGSHALRDCWERISKMAQPDSAAKNIANPVASASVACPVCGVALKYPNGSSPDAGGATVRPACKSTKVAR